MGLWMEATLWMLANQPCFSEKVTLTPEPTGPVPRFFFFFNKIYFYFNVYVSECSGGRRGQERVTCSLEMDGWL